MVVSCVHGCYLLPFFALILYVFYELSLLDILRLILKRNWLELSW